MKNDKYMSCIETAKIAADKIEIVEAGLFGIYAWNIKGRQITSKRQPGCKIARYWYLNGVRINHRYALLLTYKLLGII